MADSPLILDGKAHDLGGGMTVRRLLPQAAKRMVGPFTFFDHMGPLETAPGANTDVRPHPHIGLSTLTYLFDGRIVHRDSLGSHAVIVPGEVNWMTAGRGISHSERAHEDDRGKPRRLHGLQFWIALPDELEDCEPDFQHYGSNDVPARETANLKVVMAAGEGFGLKSNVRTSSPLILAHFESKAIGGEVDIDLPGVEYGVYVVSGGVSAGSQKIAPFQLGFFPAGSRIKARFEPKTVFMVFGGPPFPSPRHIWWNLVSSSKEKIDQAKRQWITGTFSMVPGETEFIPAPD
jgi:redox-sensitive bicupin YhaK (pirin superfamily)